MNDYSEPINEIQALTTSESIKKENPTKEIDLSGICPYEFRRRNPNNRLIEMRDVEKIFQKLPKPLDWRSFYNNDLNLIVDICMEVQDASIQHNLNKSQTRALAKLNAISESEFRGIVNPLPSASRGLSDFSATEIEAIANKEIQKQALAEQAELRKTPSLSSEGKILLQHRLGIPDERKAKRLKINRKTVAKYCNRLIGLSSSCRLYEQEAGS